MNIQNNYEISLLSEDQAFGGRNVISVIKNAGHKCASTDFAILLGNIIDNSGTVNYDQSLKGRISRWYLRSSDKKGDILSVNIFSEKSATFADLRDAGIRPILYCQNIEEFIKKATQGKQRLLEVEYGEYPQYAVDQQLNNKLEREFIYGKLQKTGKVYITDSKHIYRNEKFKERIHEEYEYNNKKYIRVISNCISRGGENLSNNSYINLSDKVWVEVSPIKWYIDEKEKILVSINSLASGIRFCNRGQYSDNFKETEMYMFLNEYFAKEILPNNVKKIDIEKSDKNKEEKNNPYNFKLKKISEEDIIKGAIKSNIAVFLHGKSSEGKSARVKQIDPDCTIIYLRNSTPESLNGKSVYNGATGEMIDIKPTWLTKLEEKCEKEPKKLHILFFDEITNALPSIQGSAFNIILEKEVDGKWHLPKNVRIVAAGNEMSDSLAANQLAEPLFNRFAHVYIETTVEKWLKWASKNNIHPAIFAFIAYTREKSLRSKYNGERPNADPRKWEMASKILYETENPEMLRALVGEEITEEFIRFCMQQAITLDDVINNNYKEEEIELLNTAERYITSVSLTQVDEENLEKARNFVTKLGAEFVTIFDVLWTHDDNDRIERLAEAKLEEKTKIKGGII